MRPPVGSIVPGTALLVAIACSTNQPVEPATPPAPPARVTLRAIASGLDAPVVLTSPPGDKRLFVAELSGAIRVIKNGQLLPTPFLNVRSKISLGGEQGLLGLAFHPRFASNGFFYINYTDARGDTRVERYFAVPTADVAETNSASLVISIEQPFPNHNGGMIEFGPDGMLYVGMGDGGGGGDPMGHGQNLGTLLGKMLRLDVDRVVPYSVPPDNPFVKRSGARGEVWAYGLRNPWRFAFDREDGLLYIGDVGQALWEEIDVVPATRAGVNYGWSVREGNHCFSPAAGCDTTGIHPAALEYGHEDGCSIAGGYVYRGATMPGLRGHYFYSDLCSGFLRSFRYLNGQVTSARDWGITRVGTVLSLGQDSDGEVYVLSGNGSVYRITPD
jgi:glucose/arabinose dehydrogenase